MMVALLTVEDINAGKYTWDDTLRWNRVIVKGRRYHRRHVNVPAAYTLRDVFKATMIASDNVCAEQMAIYIGQGNLAATIQRMNVRAAELGMNKTIYFNPSGLPGARSTLDNASTPIDQLVLGLELLKHDEVLDITSMGYAQVNNGNTPSIIRNHNGLAIDYNGDVDGLKTGYTRRAGFCLVGTTSKCGHRLVSVVLGCSNRYLRNEVVRDMFNGYYTSIGLDPIGKYCPAPYANQQQDPKGDGEWVMMKEKVKSVHVVRNGESLSKIAAKYHCSVSQLKSWNKKKVPASGRIYKGQSLVVKTTVTRRVWVEDTTSDESDEGLADNNQDDDCPVEPVYHTVTAGDTLYSIARKYGIASVEQLKSINHIGDAKSIQPGMKIKVKVDG
jgi:D-alanyl-D-alanine carboxypeptidase (penicillin-binding protein 5/6)